MMDNDLVKGALDAARRALRSPNQAGDAHWRDEDIQSWLKALDAIERRIAGQTAERGFSIVRSLDASPGTEGPKSDVLMSLAATLRSSGIDDYR